MVGGAGVVGGAGLQSLCCEENTLLYCWEEKALDLDFLSETVVLNDPNEIWRHCVCVCVCAADRRRSALIPASFCDG